MKAEEKLDQLLLASQKDFNKLPELIAFFAEVSAQSRFDLNNLYGAKIKDACHAWEQETEVAKGLYLLCVGLTSYYNTRFNDVAEPVLKAMDILKNAGQRDLFGLANWIYGANNRSLGQLDEAVKYLHKGGDIISENGILSIYKCFCYYQLSEINNHIKDYQAAEKYCLLSISIAEKLNSLTGMFRAYNGLANLYLNLERYDEAKEYLNKSLAIEGLSESQKSRSKCDLGILYYQIHQLEASEILLTENYEERMALDLKDAASTSLLALVKTQLALDKTEQALSNLKKALAIIEEYNSISKKLEGYRLLAEVHYSLKGCNSIQRIRNPKQKGNSKATPEYLSN
jgi:tetratricopeptide (TPR) repeat protein